MERRKKAIVVLGGLVLVVLGSVALVLSMPPTINACAQAGGPKDCPSTPITTETVMSYRYQLECSHCMPSTSTPTPGGYGVTPINTPICKVANGNSCVYATQYPEWVLTPSPDVTIPANCAWVTDDIVIGSQGGWRCGSGWSDLYETWTPVPSVTATASPTLSGGFISAGKDDWGNLNTNCYLENKWTGVGVYTGSGSYMKTGCIWQWQGQGSDVTIEYTGMGNPLFRGWDGPEALIKICNQMGCGGGGENSMSGTVVLGNQSQVRWYAYGYSGNRIYDGSYKFVIVKVNGQDTHALDPTPTPLPSPTAGDDFCSNLENFPDGAYRDTTPIADWDGIEVVDGACYTVLPRFHFTVPAISGLWDATEVGWLQFSVCTKVVTIAKLALLGMEIPAELFILPVLAWLISLIYKL